MYPRFNEKAADIFGLRIAVLNGLRVRFTSRLLTLIGSLGYYSG